MLLLLFKVFGQNGSLNLTCPFGTRGSLCTTNEGALSFVDSLSDNDEELLRVPIFLVIATSIALLLLASFADMDSLIFFN